MEDQSNKSLELAIVPVLRGFTEKGGILQSAKRHVVNVTCKLIQTQIPPAHATVHYILDSVNICKPRSAYNVWGRERTKSLLLMRVDTYIVRVAKNTYTFL